MATFFSSDTPGSDLLAYILRTLETPETFYRTYCHHSAGEDFEIDAFEGRIKQQIKAESQESNEAKSSRALKPTSGMVPGSGARQCTSPAQKLFPDRSFNGILFPRVFPDVSDESCVVRGPEGVGNPRYVFKWVFGESFFYVFALDGGVLRSPTESLIKSWTLIMGSRFCTTSSTPRGCSVS